MKKKKKGKKWYKNIWIWLSVIGVVLCATNIVLACLFSSNGANIFTAISGWVSFLATLGVGIFAALQSKRYKQENDRYLSEQAEQNREFMQEQRDLAWRKSRYDIVYFTLTDFTSHSREFAQYCDIKTILTPIKENKISEYELFDYYNKNKYKFVEVIASFIMFVRYPNLYCKQHAELYNNLETYHKSCAKVLNHITLAFKSSTNIYEAVRQKEKQIIECNTSFEKLKKDFILYSFILAKQLPRIYDGDISDLKNSYKDMQKELESWQEKIKQEQSKQNKGENDNG